jgi:hypothetical protein
MVARRWIGRLAPASAFVLLAATAAQTAGAVQGDRIPPAFRGLTSATTCIPGPAGGTQTTRYHLAWTSAKDNATLSSRIVYEIYQATSPGREEFFAPTYTARRGATTFATPPLPANEIVYFVVRARDAAGNVDRNRRERRGMNLCV